jgi:transcriptional regulator NrdR family protein
MNCPVCNSSKSNVGNVRKNKYDHVYRRRTCEKCGEKFTTYEVEVNSLYALFDGQFDETISEQIENILMNEFPSMDSKRGFQKKISVV